MASDSGNVGNLDSEMKGKQQIIDAELDMLLDDALSDFENVPSHQNKTQIDKENLKKYDSDSNKVESTVNDHLDDFTFDQIYENLFKMVANDSDSSSKDSSIHHGDVTETIQKALSGLSEDLGNMEGGDDMSNEMMEMLSKMNMDEGEGSFMPLVHDMMSNLLSKEVIYPSLKDISTKYPGWLTKNEGKLQASEMKKYKDQYSLIQQIVNEYECESSTDNEKTKKDRFEKILDLMQNMQQLGHPPKEILGDLAKDLPSDGLNFLPGMNDPSKCSIS